MPKKKKQPRNAYYFFISDKKKEYERQGTRFRSIQDVFAMENLREEWKCLDPTAKSKYDQLAKEAKLADKEDLTNKFTCAGESYAQVNQRVSQERREEELKEEILSNLTMEGPGLNGQKFVVFKSIDVCEVGYPPDSEFLPAELAIGSFSIATGHISNYHTLVDIVNTPLGYAAQAKDNFEATALPLPGSDKFKPAHRNYFKILQNLKRFIQSYVTPVHGFYPVFIKPDNDKPVDEQVLKWMVKESRRIGPYEGFDDEAENELYDFFNYLKFLKVTKLLLRLGGVARVRCPTFRSHVASFNYLENAAVHVLSAGVYDYFPNITCSYHNLSTEDTESMKMNRCCRNIVLRTIFLILREVMPGMNVQPIMSHTPQSIKPQPRYELGPKVPENETKRDMDEMKEEVLPPVPNNWDVPSGSRGGRVKKPLSEEIDDPYYEPCPSTLGAFGAKGCDWGAEGDSSWGMTSTPSFSSEDFPVLGQGGGSSVCSSGRSSVVGMGAGRGRGWGSSDQAAGNSFQQQPTNQDNWSFRPNSGSGFGRGRSAHYQNYESKP